MLSLRPPSGFTAMAVWAFLPGAGHGAAYYAARQLGRKEPISGALSRTTLVSAQILGFSAEAQGHAAVAALPSCPITERKSPRYPAKAIPTRAMNIHFSLPIRSALMSAACSSRASLLVSAQSLGFSAEAHGHAAVAVLPSCPIT